MDISPGGSDSEPAEAPPKKAGGNNRQQQGQTRDCTLCSQALPKRAFSGNQWRKGPGASACTSCLQTRGDPRQVPPQKAGPAPRQAAAEPKDFGNKRRMAHHPANGPPSSAEPRPAAQPPPPARNFNPNSRTSSTTLSQITESKFADLQVGAELRRVVNGIVIKFDNSIHESTMLERVMSLG